VDESGLEELLRRARGHDPVALGELVSIYSPRVYGLLYRLTGTRDAAEDLLQETFLRVVRMIQHYEHAGKFESWLFRIAANLARDRARRIGRRGEAGSLGVVPGASEPMLPGAADENIDSPVQRLLRRESGERLAACLSRLSDAEKEIILLRHFSELSFKEIAQMLDVPLGTALARAHRALKRLREQLAEED
jgi:RNA polymerase sigma-70 factor (ECF subfamily)